MVHGVCYNISPMLTLKVALLPTATDDGKKRSIVTSIHDLVQAKFRAMFEERGIGVPNSIKMSPKGKGPKIMSSSTIPNLLKALKKTGGMVAIADSTGLRAWRKQYESTLNDTAGTSLKRSTLNDTTCPSAKKPRTS